VIGLVKNLFNNTGLMPPATSTMDSTFENMDTNHDNKVTLEEFTKYLYQIVPNTLPQLKKKEEVKSIPSHTTETNQTNTESSDKPSISSPAFRPPSTATTTDQTHATNDTTVTTGGEENENGGKNNIGYEKDRKSFDSVDSNEFLDFDSKHGDDEKADLNPGM